MTNYSKTMRKRKRRQRRIMLIIIVFFVISAAAVGVFIATTLNSLNNLTNTPVLAGGNQADQPPGWIGEPPADAPTIGNHADENLSQTDQNNQISTETTEFDQNNQSDQSQASGETTNVETPQSEFAQFSFFIEANLSDYEDFAADNPNLTAEEVVWKVNAFLHHGFYEYITFTYDRNPLLVNSFVRLPDDFVPAELVPFYDANNSLLVTPAAAAAFQQLRAAAQQDGFDIAPTSAYRTIERQIYLFERQGSVDGAVARPGHSEHHTGRAIDLWGPAGLLDSDAPTATGNWVAENAHNHGFIVRYTAENSHITGIIPEPWHITYVGVEISQYMHNNNIGSLEEFVARNPNWGLPN